MIVRQFSNSTGYTLIEALLTIFLVGTLTLLFIPLLTAQKINRLSAYRSQAAALADEALTALRRLDVSLLADQTAGPLKNILYNAGDWSVISDTTDPGNHSTPNVLELASPGSLPGESGRFLLPAGSYQDATVEAKFKVVADSPANWSFGFWLRANDTQNGYRLRLAHTTVDLDSSTGGTQNIILEKVTNGTVTRLDSDITVVSAGTWYRVAVTLAGNAISSTFNGNALVSASDVTHTSGAVALTGWRGVHLEVDDVQTITTSTETWNFDFPATPTLPAAWTRLGVNDLPDTTPTIFEDNATLTLEPATSPASGNLKQATITITWVLNSTTGSYTTTSLVGRSGVGL